MGHSYDGGHWLSEYSDMLYFYTLPNAWHDFPLWVIRFMHRKNGGSI